MTITFVNHYKCPGNLDYRTQHPPLEWECEWSCACNDKCPTCNAEIEPCESEEIDAESGDDLCDLCHSSGVNVERTTYCGETIGIECGCDESHADGTCDNPDCEDCKEELTESTN